MNNNQNKNFIIYEICINNKPAYIGQTTRSLKERFLWHWQDKKPYVSKKLHEAGKENCLIQELDTTDSQEEANEIEAYWIQQKNTLYPRGCNRTSSGQSKGLCEAEKFNISKRNATWHREVGRKPFSEESRKKMSDSRKAYLAKQKEFESIVNDPP
jgi:hypothetical protein